MADLSGINLALQTPFKTDGALDYDRALELIDIYLDCGVQGILLSSGTGQHVYLTEEECNQLFEQGARRIGGRAKVLCQTSALNQDEVIRRSRRAQDLGAEALMILPPFFEGPTDEDGVLRFYEAIDREVSVDIIGYNVPAATGVEIGAALFGRLLELDNFAYVKDSSGDFSKQQLLIATGGKVLNGCDTLVPYALLAGAVGGIWGGANFVPREAVRLYELIRAGKAEEALTLWKSILPAMACCWFGDYVPMVHAACRIMGFDGGRLRAPLREADPKAMAELEAALAPVKAA